MNKKLEFGTAGIRGILGSGEDRLNVAHVQRVIHGFAKYLKNKYSHINPITVVIGRDNRRFSATFATLSAQILNQYDIKVIFPLYLTPTPFVSFAILREHAQGGINITASHNPAEYNGIKLYNDMGSQCLPEEIKEISAYFEDYSKYDENLKVPKKEAIFKELKNHKFYPKKLYNEYIDRILKLGGLVDLSDISLIYSPLHGTGRDFVSDIFNKFIERYRLKPENVHYVKSQMYPSTSFRHCKYPNPEREKTYSKSIKQAQKHNADIILVTDPDSDRVGLVVRHNNEYVRLNGNETATIIFDYLIKKSSTSNFANQYMVYSYVSSNMPAILARKNGIKVYEVPTGFKWIGMIINEEIKKDQHCMFAFEESYGSLIDESLARDKDAIQSVAILVKIAAEYKKENKTIVDALNEIYKENGYIVSGNVEIMTDENTSLSNIQNSFINLDLDNKIVDDFNKKTDFTKSNMIKITFSNDDSWLALRPSGTEPKIKFYIFAFGKDQQEAQAKFDNFARIIKEIK
ncbi:phospho-sugar mutase [Mycoplasmopsis fermentans]|uniref:phospho-sugar mutase n=1 Tax=Mycoplasmopsis fermentans TaxID=2115 RepID=UPI000FEEED76|nr:phospho-sugar mutase [Mycoplasmopsis fermentans]RMX35060.1 phosphoglucomutase/phosphomannomutase, C-terminal domain protein [Mycoplasmopsis fermentans MF-I1]RMX35231.1 phosphoglucomutase/phosphomannomutase, C-terminal domain protein [Mycoplasmopsis fermentans MF-I2]